MSTRRLDQLLTFLAGSPEDPFILYAIASEYVKLKDQDQALVYFQKLLEIKPDYVGAYYHFGRLYESMGEKEQALAIYQQGMSVAKQVQDQHAWSELYTVYQSALGIDPEDEEAY